MDLVELDNFKGFRHPWETARIEAVRKVLTPCLHDGIRILDIGCGDGFVSRRLFAGIDRKEITAVDINLTEERIRELQRLPGEIRYLREAPTEGVFDLVLVMDVLEHVEEDLPFLASVVEKHLTPGGKVMITVPSFQVLYGQHDVDLGHYRRYRLSGVEDVATRSTLTVLASGYLFGSLLLPKLVYNRLSRAGGSPLGVSNWQGSRTFTSLVEGVLNLDNSLLLSAARVGVKIPGLSAWVLCQKQ
jgi:SAM-dependent methyltransferase